MNPETIRILVLLRDLFLARADSHRALASLWKIDPEGYGSTEEGAQEWAGQGLGFQQAANYIDDMLKGKKP